MQYGPDKSGLEAKWSDENGKLQQTTTTATAAATAMSTDEQQKIVLIQSYYNVRSLGNNTSFVCELTHYLWLIVGDVVGIVVAALLFSSFQFYKRSKREEGKQKRKREREKSEKQRGKMYV